MKGQEKRNIKARAIHITTLEWDENIEDFDKSYVIVNANHISYMRKQVNEDYDNTLGTAIYLNFNDVDGTPHCFWSPSEIEVLARRWLIALDPEGEDNT